MINVDILREQPEIVRDTITKRGGKVELVDQFLELDASWKKLTQEVESLRSERNSLTATKESAMANTLKLGEIKGKLNNLEKEEKELTAKRQNILYQFPQIIDPEVPVGVGETANKVVKTVGTASTEPAKTHDDLMTALDWLDLSTAAKTSGARFRYLKNGAAKAHFRLMLKALEFAIAKGFTPVIPPVFAKEEVFLASGQFPAGRDNNFVVEDAFLSGTSEPLLLALGMNKTFTADQLPLRLVGFSTCFRREAGSYGKDTKGMFRQHQFDKVEMVSICKPEDSAKEHEYLLSLEEEFVNQFNLPYQVVLIGSGDLGDPAAKKYDVETWFPGQQKYRETHSVSNCGDFQARSFGMKVKEADGKEVVAHTLNGTLVTERLLLAIIENNQTSDGQVNLPESLS